MRTRATSLAVTCALVLAAAVLPGTSTADHQTAKNGCSSLAPQTGSLTSGIVNGVQGATGIRFQTWWEIESVDPVGRDQLIVEARIDNDQDFVELEPRLNPTEASGSGAPDVPMSNVGIQQKPAFEQEVRDLPRSPNGMLQLRFRFDSVDPLFNGFRGWGIDDVEVLVGGTRLTLVEDFESGDFRTFTPDNNDRWSVVNDGALPEILSPTIDPDLITLGAGDDGRLPASGVGDNYAWFGQSATGTFCGSDAAHGLAAQANVAPTAAFNVNPPTARTSDTVTFDGSPSSDPEGALASHTWDFGDGSPAATGASVGHTYVKKGTYNVTLTVADAQGATSTATYALVVGSNLGDRILVADKLDDLPNPRPFTNVNVEPTEGRVFIQIDGRVNAAQTPGAPRGFIPLTQAARVPLRAVLDTSRGKVRIESARDRRARRTQRAEFFDGRFSMRQPRVRRGPLTTEMVLKGGSFRGCPRARGAESAQRRRRNSRVRRLWGNGRGRFRTRGRYSSATVRGTTWLVEDRCNGTLTRLPRRPRTSVVDVRDLVTRRTVRLRAGRSYLARPRASGRR